MKRDLKKLRVLYKDNFGNDNQIFYFINYISISKYLFTICRTNKLKRDNFTELHYSFDILKTYHIHISRF